MFKSRRTAHRRAVYPSCLLILAFNIGLLLGLLLTYQYLHNTTHDDITSSSLPANVPPAAPLLPSSSEIDTFATYRYRTHPSCNISSPSLYAASTPPCPSRHLLLDALTSGGRIGFSSPYQTTPCSMTWHNTSSICAILSRFTRVIVVGDSMMRHLVGALNVLLREDLGYGAVTDWNFSPQERKECFCNHQFDVKSCSVQGIFRTRDVLKNDPGSFACGKNTGKKGGGEGQVDVVIEMMLRWPLVPDEVARYVELLSPTKPEKPYAFIFGHGLWNDLDLAASLNWLDDLMAATVKRAPYLGNTAAAGGAKGGREGKKASLFPRLFVTPSAAGPAKPDQFIVSQGDKALQIFEESMRLQLSTRYGAGGGSGGGVEHLGTWNMSIQANKYDGVHLDLRGNLVKAMSVVNWLGMIEVDEW